MTIDVAGLVKHQREKVGAHPSAVLAITATLDQWEQFLAARPEEGTVINALRMFADRTNWANLSFKGTSGEGLKIKAIGWAGGKMHPAEIAERALAALGMNEERSSPQEERQ